MTEPDLSRCALIPPNLSRRGHTRWTASDKRGAFPRIFVP